MSAYQFAFVVSRTISVLAMLMVVSRLQVIPTLMQSHVLQGAFLREAQFQAFTALASLVIYLVIALFCWYRAAYVATQLTPDDYRRERGSFGSIERAMLLAFGLFLASSSLPYIPTYFHELNLADAGTKQATGWYLAGLAMQGSIGLAMFWQAIKPARVEIL